MFNYRRQTKSENEGSQKEPIAQAVTGRFDRAINPGDRVVTFTATYGKKTHLDEGIFKGIMITRDFYRDGPDAEWQEHRAWTYYVVERADGKRTKLHYVDNMCHGDVTLDQLIGQDL